MALTDVALQTRAEPSRRALPFSKKIRLGCGFDSAQLARGTGYRALNARIRIKKSSRVSKLLDPRSLAVRLQVLGRQFLLKGRGFVQTLLAKPPDIYTR